MTRAMGKFGWVRERGVCMDDGRREGGGRENREGSK